MDWCAHNAQSSHFMRRLATLHFSINWSLTLRIAFEFYLSTIFVGASSVVFVILLWIFLHEISLLSVLSHLRIIFVSDRLIVAAVCMRLGSDLIFWHTKSTSKSKQITDDCYVRFVEDIDCRLFFQLVWESKMQKSCSACALRRSALNS